MPSRSPLSRLEVCRLLAEFESEHAVENYTTDMGFNVWPIVRYTTAKRLHRPLPDGTANGTHPNHRRPRLQKLRKGLQLLHSMVDRQLGESIHARRRTAHSSEIVLVTQSNRRELVAGCWMHYLALPLMRELANRGLSMLVWETGEPNPPRQRHHRPVEGLLAGEWKRHRMQPGHSSSPVAPPWFPEYVNWFSGYSDWTRDRLQRESHWSSHAEAIRHVEILSHAFERWLRRTGCRLLIVDCWSTREAMSAILAARRLRIPCVEIQHGLIAANNYMYTHWTRAPRAGFELMPESIWVWGRRTAEILATTNEFQRRQILGGSPWLNWWRGEGEEFCRRETERAARMTGGSQLCVLFTAQPQVDTNMLWRAIQSSPDSWKWLIRIHRSADARDVEIRQRVENLGKTNVEVHEAKDIPLYALLKVVDVHVTGFSTCAQEALAFGVASVLIDSNGREAFERELSEGSMLFANDDRDILRMIPHARDISAERCRKTSEPLYAPDDDFSNAINSLLHMVTAGTFPSGCKGAQAVST